MQDPNQPAGVPNGLLVPDHRLAVSFSRVLVLATVFLYTESLIRFADWKDQKECICRARDKSEEFGVIDAENIMEREGVGKAKLVNQGGHNFRIVFCDTESVGTDGENSRDVDHQEE